MVMRALRPHWHGVSPTQHPGDWQSLIHVGHPHQGQQEAQLAPQTPTEAKSSSP